MSQMLEASMNTIVVSGQYYMGHMLTIDSRAEQEYVHNTPGVKSDGWIALSDDSSEGKWRWIDGPEAGMSPAWIAWSGPETNGGFSPEPNGGTSENCGVSTAGLLWFDISCGQTRWLVIEYEQQSSIAGTICMHSLNMFFRVFITKKSSRQSNNARFI
jgi:hypothetical protein